MLNTLNNAAYVGSNMVGNTGDSNKIADYTPGVSSFGAGVSFTPNPNAALNGGYPAETQNLANTTEVAAKFAGAFDGIDIGTSSRGLSGGSGANDTDSTATKKEDMGSWGVGTKIAYQDLELAGSYTDNENTGVTKARRLAGDDTGGWWGGIAYGRGSLAYMNSWAGRGAGIQDDTVDYLSLGSLYSAALGPNLYATYQSIDLDRNGSASDNAADLFMVRSRVSF